MIRGLGPWRVDVRRRGQDWAKAAEFDAFLAADHRALGALLDPLVGGVRVVDTLLEASEEDGVVWSIERACA